jgi:hypothetical protein
MNGPNKLECLYLAGLSSLLQCLRLRVRSDWSVPKRAHLKRLFVSYEEKSFKILATGISDMKAFLFLDFRQNKLELLSMKVLLQ